MTIDEASEKYCIPIEVLREYEKMGLCNAVKRVMGAWQYDNQDIERLGMIITLNDIGLSKAEIDEFMRAWICEEKDVDGLINMLTEKRRVILDRVHFLEKQIDNLDNLKYYIKKECNKKG